MRHHCPALHQGEGNCTAPLFPQGEKVSQIHMPTRKKPQTNQNQGRRTYMRDEKENEHVQTRPGKIKKKRKEKKKGKNELIFYIFTRVNKLNVAQVCRPGMGGGRRGRAGRSAAGDPPGRSVGTPRRIKIPMEGKTRRKRAGGGGGRSHLDGADAPGKGGGWPYTSRMQGCPPLPHPGTPHPESRWVGVWWEGGRE